MLHNTISNGGGMVACLRQRGFSVVAAIFLLLLFAGLAALMMTMGTVQHGTAAQDVRGARAYQAARAGVEWGIYQLTRNGACAASANPVFGGALAEFTVTVNCAAAGASPFVEDGNAVSISTITATAVPTGIVVGNLGYVERQIRVTVDR